MDFKMTGSIVGAIFGGFTILGVFLTLSAWINGRSIKRYIGELIKSEGKATRELMAKLSDQHEAMIKQHEAMIKLIVPASKSNKDSQED
ncbi:MAG: hypothetical protein QME40_00675 [bacterium]|nr:hypothetical protein [bacterium]